MPFTSKWRLNVMPGRARRKSPLRVALRTSISSRRKSSLKQVESAEGYWAIVLPPPDQLEHGQSIIIAGNCLAIQHAWLRQQGCDGCHN
jgi:hypothetical protein